MANSLANLSYNLLGYLPAPSIYGFVCSVTGGEKSRFGIGVLMYSTIFSSGFLLAALVCKLKRTHGKSSKLEGFDIRNTMAL